jgi:hypothetical protein
MNVDQQAQCSFTGVEVEEWDQTAEGKKNRGRGIGTYKYVRYVQQILVGTVNVSSSGPFQSHSLPRARLL